MYNKIITLCSPQKASWFCLIKFGAETHSNQYPHYNTLLIAPIYRTFALKFRFLSRIHLNRSQHINHQYPEHLATVEKEINISSGKFSWQGRKRNFLLCKTVTLLKPFWKNNDQSIARTTFHRLSFLFRKFFKPQSNYPSAGKRVLKKARSYYDQRS